MEEDTSDYQVLVVDDEALVCTAVQRTLGSEGFDVLTCTAPDRCVDIIRSTELDLVVCDIDMPGISGLELLEQIGEIAPSLPVVMLTSDGTSETAVRALRGGAFNYLTKRALTRPDELVLTLTRAATHGRMSRYARSLERRLDASRGFDDLLGTSAGMNAVFDTIVRIAPLDVSVLIHGQSGTGKELVARAIHRHSERAGGAFVAINCAAIPEGLIDSELFGHVRGAYTGAATSRAGAFERARGGTLFLDEIGDVPAAVQVRLLRVLQEREIVRVGAGDPIPVDVRVIAATHVDIESAVEHGDFRADLYFRLNVVRLELPALQDRGDDVLLLAAHLIEKHARRLGKPAPELGPGVAEALTAYEWPGNVRELENALVSALAVAPAGIIECRHLPERVRHAREQPRQAVALDGDIAWADDMSLSEARAELVARFDRAYLADRMRRAEGSISRAARLAGVDRSNFKRTLTKYGLRRLGNPQKSSS
jgi:two-component system response regulator HydG